MLQILFSTKERRQVDHAEISRLYRRYSENAVAIVRRRAQDSSLSDRDRRHWKRIYQTMIFLGARDN